MSDSSYYIAIKVAVIIVGAIAFISGLSQIPDGFRQWAVLIEKLKPVFTQFKQLRYQVALCVTGVVIIIAAFVPWGRLLGVDQAAKEAGDAIIRLTDERDAFAADLNKAITEAFHFKKIAHGQLVAIRNQSSSRYESWRNQYAGSASDQLFGNDIRSEYEELKKLVEQMPNDFADRLKNASAQYPEEKRYNFDEGTLPKGIEDQTEQATMWLRYKTKLRLLDEFIAELTPTKSPRYVSTPSSDSRSELEAERDSLLEQSHALRKGVYAWQMAAKEEFTRRRNSVVAAFEAWRQKGYTDEQFEARFEQECSSLELFLEKLPNDFAGRMDAYSRQQIKYRPTDFPLPPDLEEGTNKAALFRDYAGYLRIVDQLLAEFQPELPDFEGGFK